MAYITEAAGSAVPPTSPELTQANDAFADVAGRLEKTANRIENALDRLHGGRPTAIRKDEVGQTDMPGNAIATLRHTGRHLSMVSARFDDLAQRLDSIA